MRKSGKTANALYRRGRRKSPKGKAMKDTIESMVRAGKKAPPEVIREARRVVRESRKHPDEYDPDCPPSSPQALAEFAALAREVRKRKPSPVVSIRVKPETLEKYKALGRGYSGTMGDVLNYVADNPEILAKVL
jgi:uncharacterized protein (DUF4415 family)